MIDPFTHPVTKHPYITTFSGERINFRSMTSRQVNALDVAHSLAMQCRYVGHCAKFYCVAEHSVLVAGLAEAGLESVETRLCALLHDAAEAYTGDHPSPLKEVIPEIRGFEDQIETQVGLAFGLPELTHPVWRTVKRYDTLALHIEAPQLFRPAPSWVENVPKEFRDFGLNFWDPYTARKEFIETLQDLWSRVPVAWRERANPSIDTMLFSASV